MFSGLQDNPPFKFKKVQKVLLKYKRRNGTANTTEIRLNFLRRFPPLVPHSSCVVLLGSRRRARLGAISDETLRACASPLLVRRSAVLRLLRVLRFPPSTGSQTVKCFVTKQPSYILLNIATTWCPLALAERTIRRGLCGPLYNEMFPAH